MTSQDPISQRARDLHFSSLVVDTHADTISRMTDDGDDLATATGKGHLDLPRIREGNLGVQWWSCYVAAKEIPEKNTLDRCLQLLDGLNRFCAANPDDVEIALTAADTRRIVAEGKHAAVPCIEGGHAINDSLAVLRLYWELGMRYITLTHFNTNNWADASTDAVRNNGLSLFGRDVIREMNRLGMVVDISHVSDKTFWDAIEVTDKPIMASHSSAWSLCQHPRNMKDDMLRAVASNGGVVNVNFYPAFVLEETRVATDKLQEATWDEIEDVEKFARRSAIAHYSGTPEYVAQQRAEIQKRRMASWHDLPQPNLSDVVDHIEHIAKGGGRGPRGAGIGLRRYSRRSHRTGGLLQVPGHHRGTAEARVLGGGHQEDSRREHHARHGGQRRRVRGRGAADADALPSTPNGIGLARRLPASFYQAKLYTKTKVTFRRCRWERG